MERVICYTVCNGIIFKDSGKYSETTGEFQPGSFKSTVVKPATSKHYKKDTFRGKLLRQWSELKIDLLMERGEVESI